MLGTIVRMTGHPTIAVDGNANQDKSANTRRRLLDAAEALVADEGYGAPSHRSIARRAGVHVALVNYHFGSKEMLLEGVVARRADRLLTEWRRALEEATATGRPTATGVLCAYWAPFATPDATADGEWRNYLCAIAWLSQAHDGESWWTLQFAPVERAFREALSRALPNVPPEVIERGFRYSRELLDAVLLHRCNKVNGRCTTPPNGLREDDVDGLIAFLAAGLEALPTAPPQGGPRICRTQVVSASSD